MLIKASIIVIPIAGVALALYCRLDWKPYAAAIGIALVIVGAWTTSNFIRLGEFVPIANNSGIVLWMAVSDMIAKHGTVAVFEPPDQYEVSRVHGYELDTLDDGAIEWKSYMTPSLEYEIAQNQRALAAAVEIITTDTLRYVRSIAGNLVVSYVNTAGLWHVGTERQIGGDVWYDQAYQTLFVSSTLLSFIALILRMLFARLDGAPLLFLVFVIMLWTLFYSVVAHGLPRFVEPVLPLCWLSGLTIAKGSFVKGFKGFKRNRERNNE